MIYLDNAATTPITQTVFNAMTPYLTTYYGNPSSLHSAGRQVKNAVEKARKQIADAINAESEQIFFTSGATESNNWVCSMFDRVLCSPVEHHSVLNIPNCIKMSPYISLETEIYNTQPNLISHMYVNNEIGVIYPITEMVETAHEWGVPFHIDATQAFGHIFVDVKKLDCDYLSLSGHKFHAPKGVGILYAKDPTKLKANLYGGGQERGFRSGTENVASIVGMGKAAELYQYNSIADEYIKTLRDELKNFILKNIPDVIINSKEDGFVNNILSVSFKNVESESLVLMMDTQGICISGGSACNSGSLEPSETIKALKLPEDYVYGTVRFSFSALNTMAEIKSTEVVLYDIINKLR